jgi:hypothetical protein
MFMTGIKNRNSFISTILNLSFIFSVVSTLSYHTICKHQTTIEGKTEIKSAYRNKSVPLQEFNSTPALYVFL